MTWTPDTSKLDAERAAKAAKQTADLELFRPLPHNGTETSKAAAERAQPMAGTQRHRILCAIVASPNGLTRGELIAAAGVKENATNPRTAELLAGGYIEERGTRDHRAVLFATDKGRAVLAQKDAA